MKTQISILVKKEGFLTSSFTVHPIWDRSPRSFVKVWIDSENSEPLELVPRKEPYLIDVEPGVHELLFKDGAKKMSLGKTVKASLAIGLGAFAFGATGRLGSAVDMATTIALGSSGKKIEDGYAAFELKEGDVFKLSCQVKDTNGTVRVEAL